MKNNNYTSFFKTKPKKVERYIRCRKCGGNMEWVEYYPPEIKCPKCGYTVYPKPYEPDCVTLPETLEEYFELYEKARMKMEKLKPCPFCGEEAQIFTDDEMGYLGNAQYIVKCGNCLCGTGHYNNPEYAIEAWNKRANDKEDAKC